MTGDRVRFSVIRVRGFVGRARLGPSIWIMMAELWGRP